MLCYIISGLDNSIPLQPSFTPPNSNITSYMHNLRQYIPKSGHTHLPHDTTKPDEDGFEHILRRIAIKESWDNKSGRVSSYYYRSCMYTVR